MAGRRFEELIVGQTFEHEIRRTIAEADNMWFSDATLNPAIQLIMSFIAEKVLDLPKSY